MYICVYYRKRLYYHFLSRNYLNHYYYVVCMCVCVCVSPRVYWLTLIFIQVSWMLHTYIYMQTYIHTCTVYLWILFYVYEINAYRTVKIHIPNISCVYLEYTYIHTYKCLFYLTLICAYVKVTI